MLLVGECGYEELRLHTPAASTVGFDHLFDLINNSQHAENQKNYPPYDIARTGEDTYRISLAVAGFSPEDLTVTAQQNLLNRSSGRQAREEQGAGAHPGRFTAH